MLSDTIAIRSATSADIEVILRHRRGMYEDMGETDAAALAGMVATSRAYLIQALASGSCRAWLADAAECVVGGGLVLISPWLSHPFDQRCQKVSILNMYVDPEYRRRGIARQLMLTMVEWCRKEGFVQVDLHASKAGRPLYESLGFQPTTEMRLKIRQE